MTERRALVVDGAERDVVWSEERDNGGMFPSTVGVWREDGRFVAFVQDGWGGGVHSRQHPDEAAAKADIDRLWERLYYAGPAPRT